MKPIVSVIIPAYNAAPYIAKTVQSVFDQTIGMKAIEIIIVNDGSKDETAIIIDQWSQHPNFTIKHTENRGASAARELGRQLAVGQYIQYLDCDDLLMPNKLELQINAIEKSNAEICYGNWQKFREQEGALKITETIYPSQGADTVLSTFTTFWCPPAALLFTKAVVDRIGSWPDNLPIIQDARYLQNAAMEGAKFVKLDHEVGLYRVTDQSLSNRNGAMKFYIDVFNNTLEVWELWKVKYGENEIYKQAIIENLRNCAKIFLLSDKSMFNKCIEEILRIKPDYIPRKSKLMRILSILIGFRNATLIAHRVKQLISINRI